MTCIGLDRSFIVAFCGLLGWTWHVPSDLLVLYYISKDYLTLMCGCNRLAAGVDPYWSN